MLIFNASGPKFSPWTDPDFDVTEKGDNNFQDTGRFQKNKSEVFISMKYGLFIIILDFGPFNWSVWNLLKKESRTLSIHYNRNSLAWKCVWDGELYYRIGDFSIQWQKDQYNVTMSFINTIDLDDVSQVRFTFPSQALGKLLSNMGIRRCWSLYGHYFTLGPEVKIAQVVVK